MHHRIIDRTKNAIKSIYRHLSCYYQGKADGENGVDMELLHGIQQAEQSLKDIQRMLERADEMEKESSTACIENKEALKAQRLDYAQSRAEGLVLVFESLKDDPNFSSMFDAAVELKRRLDNGMFGRTLDNEDPPVEPWEFDEMVRRRAAERRQWSRLGLGVFNETESKDTIKPINRPENNVKLDDVPTYGCPGDSITPEGYMGTVSKIKTSDGEVLTIGNGGASMGTYITPNHPM
jgi:hypothetical protein